MSIYAWRSPVTLMMLSFICLLGAVLGSSFVSDSLASVSIKEKATISILSHTDFLPDATGVYDRRANNGRDKEPGFDGNNDVRAGSDSAYDHVDRKHGYDEEAVGLPEVLSDAILERLTKSKRFIPVERKALRTAVLEQRFGQEITKSYMDRTLDKAIQNMDTFEIGGGLAMHAAVPGAEYNDMLHDFKDLANAIGADYLVLGNLHQLGSDVQSVKVPHSESGKVVNKKIAKARLRLRVIDAKSGTVVGADSLQMEVSSLIFTGGKEKRDDFLFMDQVALQASRIILDMVFPAKVVSLDPLIISRGENDGVKKGDTFAVVREGKEIKESSGAVIARLKEPVGTVTVVEVQETIAIVEAADPSLIHSGDLAVLAPREDVKVAPMAEAVPLNQNGSETVSKRPRIAVGLVKAGSTARTGPESSTHVPLFTDTIISRLVQSKRFTVIDRQEVDQLLDEQLAQALAENTDLPSVMGTLKGCDYMIIGSLQNFSMEKKFMKLPHSTRVMDVLDGYAEGNVRIVDVRSGDILESRKVSVSKQLESSAGEDRLVAALADVFASHVVANLLNAVYPVKVAAVAADGSVYINRGRDGNLKQQARLAAYRLGEKVVDPDTGVILGSMDTRIGQLQLVKVEENRSVGNVLGGIVVQTGDLLKVESSGVDRGQADRIQRSGGTIAGQGQGAEVRKQPARKATLALVGLQVNARRSFTDSSKVSAIIEGTMDQLSDLVIDALEKTNRFSMMERRQVDQLIDEKMFHAISQGSDIRQYLKELEGADYLVLGELTNFYLHVRKKKVPYLDEYEVSYTGFIEGNMRIADGHSGRIVATEKFRVKKPFKDMGIEEVRTRLIDQYAAVAAAGIMTRIYPIKVLASQPDGTVFINRGADGGLKQGAIFSVERPGEKLIDPDTGLSFGTAESRVGMLEVTVVEASRARGRMITGSVPVSGDILRNQQQPVSPKRPQKAKVAW